MAWYGETIVAVKAPKLPEWAIIQDGVTILGYGNSQEEAWEMFRDSDPTIPAWDDTVEVDPLENPGIYGEREDGTKERPYRIHPHGYRNMNNGDLFWTDNPAQILEYWLPLMGRSDY
jgi:hypothetical protein